MKNEENNETAQVPSQDLNTSSPPTEMGEVYPKEAMRPGTYVRVHRLSLAGHAGRLGLIDDAFYGELDADGKKIIVYTIVLLPVNTKDRYNTPEAMNYALTNEYEYEVTGYLMIKPVDMEKLSNNLSRGLIL
tara:strand:- start:770 stop:1165 length:396 start_codon:yes stop_codon:yes gene_type:complete